MNIFSPNIPPTSETRNETVVPESPAIIPPGNKLHNLELIKVAVLITVISIIMLTTCRMLFQLVVRIPPRKPP